MDEAELIDGFYKDNGFLINDIMLVLKPTGVREGANHSTYSNAIIGEVVGVPNKVVNAFEIMPLALQKRAKNLGRVQQGEVIAPYGSGIKFLSRPKPKKKTPKKGREQKSIEEIGRFFNMNEQGFMPKVINTSELRRLLPAGVTIDTARTGSYFLRDANGRKLNPFSPRGREQKDIVDIINESRNELNFRDEVIKDYLIRVRKFPSKVVNELLQVHLIRRKVDPRVIIVKNSEGAAGGTIRQVSELAEGISQENAKKIIADVKKLKLKIQIKIQGEELRAQGKKRDDLQEAISAIQSIDIGLPIEFINFRD